MGKHVVLNRPIGWEPDSWAYHGDDGKFFLGQREGRALGDRFGHGDTVGCGVNFRDGVVFFTKNGHWVGCSKWQFRRSFSDPHAKREITGLPVRSMHKHKLFPAVSFKRQGDGVVANFGQTPFKYNIEDMMKVGTMWIVEY